MTDDELATTGNVVVVTFREDGKAYEALSTLKQRDAQGRAKLMGAAVVTRGDDGHVVVKDKVGDDSYAGTAGGGLIGLLVGILGGPLGILLGGATGLLLGSLYDLDDVDETESALSEVSKTVQVGRPTLLAHVIEEDTEVVDDDMARLTGTVVRRPVYEVEGEIARAQEAQREAKKAARAKLRKAHEEKDRAEAHAKVEELKGKLHRERKPAPTSA
jgi:uncharacterized membrane protein